LIFLMHNLSCAMSVPSSFGVLAHYGSFWRIILVSRRFHNAEKTVVMTG